MEHGSSRVENREREDKGTSGHVPGSAVPGEKVDALVPQRQIRVPEGPMNPSCSRGAVDDGASPSSNRSGGRSSVPKLHFC